MVRRTDELHGVHGSNRRDIPSGRLGTTFSIGELENEICLVGTRPNGKGVKPWYVIAGRRSPSAFDGAHVCVWMASI